MILPVGLTFERWSAEFALNTDAALPRCTDDNWREWAAAYIEQTGTAAPDPAQFALWQDWAERLLEVTDV